MCTHASSIFLTFKSLCVHTMIKEFFFLLFVTKTFTFTPSVHRTRCSTPRMTTTTTTNVKQKSKKKEIIFNTHRIINKRPNRQDICLCFMACFVPLLLNFSHIQWTHRAYTTKKTIQKWLRNWREWTNGRKSEREYISEHKMIEKNIKWA